MVMKRALVTGATGDIGAAIARYLIERDIQVIGTYHIESKTVDSYTDKNFFLVHLDLTQESSISKCIQDIHETYGGIDFLVNCAGIKMDGALDTLSRDNVREVIQVNLLNTILLTRECLPMIKENKGRVVNIASLSGEIGNNQQTNYSASKAGLIGFTKALARDMAKYDVSVNAISPGLIKSRMVSSIPIHLQERMVNMIPQKRFGTPRSIAELVYFFLTNEENYITGQSIKIDGGLSM